MGSYQHACTAAPQQQESNDGAVQPPHASALHPCPSQALNTLQSFLEVDKSDVSAAVSDSILLSKCLVA